MEMPSMDIDKETMMLKVAYLIGIICTIAWCECPPPRKHFCFPEHWQSDLSAVNVSSDGHGKVQISQEAGRIYVDRTVHKMRMDIVLPSGELTYLALFKQKVLYVILNGKNCTKIHIGKEMKWCTPDNANVSKPYRLGYKPSISVVDFEYYFSGMKFVLSASGKSPVSFRMFATESGAFSAWVTTFFQNYLPIKPNPKVFIVPKICKPHNEV
ncbi:uncharacterized protein LOC132748078 isoform X2 [Ruditapes philippinarum]|uniref:uncharacterized protein LOC132748078 isoform X2 n=1 Tax=Ruditapes philippinarum TaxID=129788 RepID=UPI00295B8BF1|nr:uncharacterized protein LOC132748078 isoform X2 [Ruditapes philippinarum]